MPYVVLMFRRLQLVRQLLFERGLHNILRQVESAQLAQMAR